MDLGDWLRSLGLGQYKAGFRENAVDDTLLPVFTRTSRATRDDVATASLLSEKPSEKSVHASRRTMRWVMAM